MSSACGNSSSSAAETFCSRASPVSRGRGRVEDLGQRVELALDQPHGALIRDVDHPRADERLPARVDVLAAADQRARSPTSTIVIALPSRSGAGRELAHVDADPVVRDRDLVVVARRSSAARRRTPLTKVPLFEPRSSSVHPSPSLPQPRMLPRDAHVGDEDLAVRASTDHVLALAELVSPARDRAGEEDQRGHGVRRCSTLDQRGIAAVFGRRP